MSAPLGYFSDRDAVDYPDLNKCPDCETFFAELNCPFCGKECPEEFRAGNRKPIKVKRRRSSGGNGRVQFVPWYHTTWFILIMLFLQPIIGLILAWTGPWKTHWKVIVTVLLIMPYVLGGLLLGGLSGLIDGWLTPPEEIPIDLSVSTEEYLALCRNVDTEALFRQPDAYVDDYLCLTLTVDAVVYDTWDYESDYTRYYRCHTVQNGRTLEFLVRDWRQENLFNLTAGDVITVYGQGGGTANVHPDDNEQVILPCINARCIDLTEA